MEISADQVNISGFSIKNNEYYGISLTGSKANISANALTDNVEGGIYISEGDENLVKNNTITGGDYAIYIEGDWEGGDGASVKNEFIGNNISGIDGNAFYIDSSSNDNLVIENVIDRCGMDSSTYAIKVSYADGNEMIGNRIRNCSDEWGAVAGISG